MWICYLGFRISDSNWTLTCLFFIFHGLAWSGFDCVTITQLFVKDYCNNNMEFGCKGKHVVQLHAHTEDDWVINGIGESNDKDCQVVWTSSVNEDCDCKTMGTYGKTKVATDTNIQTSKKAYEFHRHKSIGTWACWYSNRNVKVKFCVLGCTLSIVVPSNMKCIKVQRYKILNDHQVFNP